MLRTITLIYLAGLISLPGFSQANGNAPDKKQAPAQTVETPRQFYQLNFVARELENDRVVNSRSYFIIISGNKDRGSIRAGQQVPFSTTTGQKTEWQQIHVGINIDCSLLDDLGDKIALHISADISSVVETHGDNSPPALPIIRNNRWESNVVLPLKQATILYSSDDPASKRKMQLQLTVAPVR